jgi:hypothetical protein
VAYLA